MRDAFTAGLYNLAQEDKNIMLVSGDLGFGVLKKFWEAYPEQFVNAGICEQAMTGIATGMAMEGKVVFTYSIANFPTLRCIEQIRNDAAYHHANVKIVSVGGGFCYGALGMSHHATEDIAILRALPDVAVFAPGDPVEVRAALNVVYRHQGACYLRLGRGGEKTVHTEEIKDYKLGQAIKIKDGEDIFIFSSGGILSEAHKAAGALEEKGIKCGLVSFPSVKPIDKGLIKECALKAKYIFSVEEHNIVGGFGSAVAEVMAEIPGSKAALVRIGLNDTYSSIVGSQDYLREMYGMSANAIVKRVEETITA